MSTLFAWLLAFGLVFAVPAGSPIQKMTFADLQAYIAKSDHPIIISFWATTCAPCVKEIPYLQDTAARYTDQGVELLLVSLDRPDAYPAKIAAFVQQQGVTARVLWLDEPNGAFCPQVNARWTGGMPASLFINNMTHYRRFFDRQLTDRQVGPEIRKMLAPAME